MNVLYVIADSKVEYNSARWRCDMPMTAINSTSHSKARKIDIKQWAELHDTENSSWADVIVLQRNAVAGALFAIAEWMAKGKKVLVDLDDGYEFMPQSNVSASFWINHQRINPTTKQRETLPFDPLVHLRMGLKLCTAISTPSLVIQKDRSVLNKSILVRNYPDAKIYVQAANDKKPNDRITLGWGGGGSHFDSFAETGVITALVRVMEKRPRTDLLIMGPMDVKQKMFMYARKLGSRIKGEPWGAYDEWPARLARLDIAVAPLAGKYDMRRSWLKGIEYTLEGIPWLGTDYGVDPQPYCEFDKRHLVKNQPKYWEERLLDLVDHLEEERQCMVTEREWAMQFDLFANADKIVEIYEEA